MPVLVSHGEKDPVAKAEWGRKTFEYVSELGMPTDVSMCLGSTVPSDHVVFPHFYDFKTASRFVLV